MEEKIYTIPVNEAFDECAHDHTLGCPFCRMYSKREAEELDIILGASMMEPEVRIKTNQKGFCRHHFDIMAQMKNRLSLALILQSHLQEISGKFQKFSITDLVSGKGKNCSGELSNLEKSCYVCERIDYTLDRMLSCAVYLWDTEKAFCEKTLNQPFFCLPHYRMLIEAARADMNKRRFADFIDEISDFEKRKLSELQADIDLFVKKFDYRYENEPWGNSRDSIERAIRLLGQGK